MPKSVSTVSRHQSGPLLICQRSASLNNTGINTGERGAAKTCRIRIAFRTNILYANRNTGRNALGSYIGYKSEEKKDQSHCGRDSSEREEVRNVFSHFETAAWISLSIAAPLLNAPHFLVPGPIISPTSPEGSILDESRQVKSVKAPPRRLPHNPLPFTPD